MYPTKTSVVSKPLLPMDFQQQILIVLAEILRSYLEFGMSSLFSIIHAKRLM